MPLSAYARGLVLDSVENAGSGHPGAAYTLSPAFLDLYLRELRHNPSNPNWFGRDRLVLSCGHVVLAQYTGLLASGYAISISDLRKYRQGGKCPGHPEFGLTPGIEVSSGPLGFGFSVAVGIAAGLQEWSRRTKSTMAANPSPQTPRVFCVVSDGDLMEGVSYEAASLAGLQALSNLCVIYDSNKITIDGSLDLTFREDVGIRFQSQGWEVTSIPTDGTGEISTARMLDAIQSWTPRGSAPLLIELDSTIAVGIGGMSGTSRSHGSPLGPEAVATTKLGLGLEPKLAFQGQNQFARSRRKAKERGNLLEKGWLEALSLAGSDADIMSVLRKQIVSLAAKLPEFEPSQVESLRAVNKEVISFLQEQSSWVVIGSADLAESTGVPHSSQRATTQLIASPFPESRVSFGVREKSMAGYALGLASLGIMPIVSTYLVFSDFQRTELRMAAMMQTKIVFLYTHDSVTIGGDGPTHQPVEQLSSLRAIPGLSIVRPSSPKELVACWMKILQEDRPVCLVVSREKLVNLRSDSPLLEGSARGGYVLRETQYAGNVDLLIVASGSELHLAERAGSELDSLGLRVRVVSMPCLEWFLEQEDDYQGAVCGPQSVPTVFIEAGSMTGWAKLSRDSSLHISVDKFGESDVAESLREKFGLNLRDVLKAIRKFI